MALSAIDQVRLNIGDLGTPPHLTDAQIQHFIDTGGSIDVASGLAARSLAFLFATKADQTTGRMSVGYSARAAAYRELALELGGVDIIVAPPYVGGISKAELEQSGQDTDLVQPAFTRDLHDNPLRGADDGNQP